MNPGFIKRILLALTLAMTLAAGILLVLAQLTLQDGVGATLHERHACALAVAIWHFELNKGLTIPQRLLWRYTIGLEDQPDTIAVIFSPRQNYRPRKDNDAESQAIETHVLVDRGTLKPARIYITRD